MCCTQIFLDTFFVIITIYFYFSSLIKLKNVERLKELVGRREREREGWRERERERKERL
jgi:hypothetical protein